MTVELRTRYLGLDLRSPLVASPSPLTRDLESVRALVDAGAAAIVLPSLFEEEMLYEDLHEGGLSAVGQRLGPVPVIRKSPSVVLTSDLNPQPVGVSATLTAHVSPAPPTRNP